MNSPYPSPPESVEPGPRRRVPTAVIAGTAVVLLAGTVLVLGVAGGDDKGGEKTAESGQSKRPDLLAGLGATVAQRLGSLPALSYSGTFTSNGTPVKARLTVTKAGSAIGSLTRGGERAELVTIDGRTFLKASASFWREAGGSTARPEDFAGRWAKAPTTVLGFNVKEFLAPTAVAQRLRSVRAQEMPKRVGGGPAHLLTTAQGGYWASAAAPHKLVQVTGASDSRFDVAEVADAKPLFTDLRRRVAALGGARDPGVTFQPGTLQFTNCNENVAGCTVSLPVTSQNPAVAPDPTAGGPAAEGPTAGLPGGSGTNGAATPSVAPTNGTGGSTGNGTGGGTGGSTGNGTGGSGSPGAGGTGSGGAGAPTGGPDALRAVLIATISADGRTLGACTATQTLGPARQGVLTCTVTSAGWRDWMRKARDVPGKHEYSAQARVVAEAVAKTEVTGLLAAVDRERTAR